MKLEDIPAGADLGNYSVLVDAGAFERGAGMQWCRLVKLNDAAKFPVTVEGKRSYRRAEVSDVRKDDA